MSRAESAEIARRAWAAAVDLMELTAAGELSPELAGSPEPLAVLLAAQESIAMGTARLAMRHTVLAAGGRNRG